MQTTRKQLMTGHQISNRLIKTLTIAHAEAKHNNNEVGCAELLFGIFSEQSAISLLGIPTTPSIEDFRSEYENVRNKQDIGVDNAAMSLSKEPWWIKILANLLKGSDHYSAEVDHIMRNAFGRADLRHSNEVDTYDVLMEILDGSPPCAEVIQRLGFDISDLKRHLHDAHQ